MVIITIIVGDLCMLFIYYAHMIHMIERQRLLIGVSLILNLKFWPLNFVKCLSLILICDDYIIVNDNIGNVPVKIKLLVLQKYLSYPNPNSMFRLSNRPKYIRFISIKFHLSR